MKNRILNRAFACLAVSFPALSLTAATSDGIPVFHKYGYSDYSMVSRISDNGEWGIAQPALSDDVESGQARLINISTGDETILQTSDDVTTNGACTVSDVTDDGSIVVGEYKGSAAYWSASTGEWTTLPVPDGWGSAYINAVTPDGHYAVGGAISSSSEWIYGAVMWDLTGDSIIDTPNTPTLDMQHEESEMCEFTEISADGRYAVGRLAWSYVYPPQICCFLYDIEEQSTSFIGFDSSEVSDWTAWNDSLYFTESAIISPNGTYIAGVAYVTNDAGGYYTSYLYNRETGDYELYTATDDQDMGAFAVDDYGNVYAATPYQSTPIREWSVRHGKYWYPFTNILSQAYGIDYEEYTTYDNTGSPLSVSADGMFVACMIDPTDGGSYVVELPEPLQTVCDSINLLGSYTVTPDAGTAMSYMYMISIVFDRNIEVADGTTYKNACLLDSAGNVVRNVMASGGIKVSSTSSTTLVLTFRTTSMDDGAAYTVHIDAGAIQMSGDADMTNDDIDILYYGREAVPVEIISVYPADSTEIAKIDASSSQVIFTFDADVCVTDSAAATLYRTTDGTDVHVCDLSFLVEDNRIAVVPTSTQYLYSGETYKVVLEAGAVTDMSTANASSNTANATSNAEMTVNYIGTYERTVSVSDTTLFSDDFSAPATSTTTWILYDGDGLTPVTAMQEWDYDEENTPWTFYIRDNDGDDYCAGSHSMYDPAGKSDDWMMTPQISIPDEFCTLKFDAQSYYDTCIDSLKVIIWSSEENINELNATRAATIREEGDVIFAEQLSPGENVDSLAGDWVTYTFDLAAYSGQNIYIAFINENEDQSMVFVDNVIVYRNLKYLLSLANASSVVNQSEMTIRGTLTANSEEDTYSSIKLTLYDTGNDSLCVVEEDGLALTKGDTYSFEFDTPLPLTVGEKNTFYIGIQLDDYTDKVSSYVKDLAFEPVKRVVLEEMTGTTCVNCPLGILAIEYIENIYGDLFIPISIHTYTGDQLASGMSGYTSFLGISAAPTGIIQRNGTIAAPMDDDPSTGDFVYSLDGELWFDYVQEEFETPADFDLTAEVELSDDETTIDVPITITSALDNTSLNLNVFLVLLEDGIVSYQYNTFYTTEDDALGEWGYGGAYASSVVYNYTHNDVCRYCWGDDYDGSSGFFPQSMDANEEYSVTLSSLSLPSTFNDINALKLVVILIDANTDKIANAVSVKFPGYETGISNVSTEAGTEKYKGISADADGMFNVFSVSGIRMMRTATGSDIGQLPAGLYIVNGKKITIK